jgi:hypothetical protein
MARFIASVALLGALALGACGKADPPQAAPPQPGTTPPVGERKCPDPSIKDSSNPCSPNYYKPVKGSFKGQKTF